MKKIVNKENSRTVALEAMSEIAGVVKATLGPGGQIILIERRGQNLDGSPIGPKITKDGVSVADECFTEDAEKDIIYQAVKGICKKTVNTAGDGTTTAMVLGEAILKETINVLREDPSLNPQLVKESVELAAKEVVSSLRKQALKIKDVKQIKQVATISANGDEEIGDVISKAFEAVGVEGVVTVDEGRSNRVTLDIVDGYQVGKGAEARTTFFNNKEQTAFEAEKCAVVIYDGKLLNYTDVISILKVMVGVNEAGQPTKKMVPLLLFANEFSGEVLQFLAVQRNEMGMNICPVQGPNVSHVRTNYYDDIAVYTGGTRLGNGNRNLGAIVEDDIGLAEKVVADKYKTTIYEGQGAEDDIMKRVAQLRAAKGIAESPYDVQVINDRLASLTNGVAKIGVGGQTEMEIKEKYDRIEDALNAARAAIEEGIVPGGGSTLYRISSKMKADKSVGHKILKKALQAPFNQILENIGVSGDTRQKIGADILKSNKKVYDARNKAVKNALTFGIIDPVKVTRTALENAVSIATLLSTMGGAIVYVRKNV